MRNWRTWAIVAALVVGFFASEWWDWRSYETQAGEKLRVSVTPRFQEYDYAPLNLPVKAPEIPGKDIERLREKYDRPDLIGNSTEVKGSFGNDGESSGEVIGPVVLGEFRLATPADETEILITREPDGRVGVDPISVPRPFIEFRRELEFGSGYVLGAEQGIAAWSRWSPVRVGKLRPFLEGGIRPGSGGYIMAGVVARF